MGDQLKEKEGGAHARSSVCVWETVEGTRLGQRCNRRMEGSINVDNKEQVSRKT